MAENRTLYRLFLGSPGDLGPEREIAKTVIDDINVELGEQFNCLVHLDRWEDTPPSDGRAQGYVNRLLERCDIFVGVLFREWGSPTGTYSSGFEEEYELSMARRTESGRPTIRIFFKEVDDPFLLKNPPETLQRVLTFRRKLVEERRVKFATFAAESDFARTLRRAIIESIRTFRSEAKAGEGNEERPLAIVATAASAETKNPWSHEGLRFAQEFLASSENLPKGAQLDPVLVARFRLLGSMVGAQGNDQDTVGPHDSNLLYTCRPELEFGVPEIRGLLDAGIQHFDAENVPIWKWFSKLPPNALFFRTIIGPQDRRAKAIAAATLIGLEIALDEDDREVIVSGWFEDDSDKAVRLAGLKYLSTSGRSCDLTFVEKELARNNSDTSPSAIEAVTWIRLRQNTEDAFASLWKLEPTTLSDELLDALFAHSDTISTAVLVPGVSQRCTGLRLRSVKELRRRRELAPEVARALLLDDDQWVRYEALCALSDMADGVLEIDAYSVLVRSLPGLGILRMGRPQIVGEDAYKKYLASMWTGQTDAFLRGVVETGADRLGVAFGVLVRRRFNELAVGVRADLVAFLGKITNAAVAANTNATAGTLADLFLPNSPDEITRTALARRNLDLICEHGDKSDLPLVRKALKSRTLPHSSLDLQFLGAHGRWADIELVLELVDRRSQGINFLSFDSSLDRAGAEAVYAIGRKRFSELVTIVKNHTILPYVVTLSSDAVFSKLTNKYISELLHSRSDSARRAVGLKVVRALPKQRISSILENQIKSGTSYFYNTVHWLDLGISLPRSVAKAAATKGLVTLR